tara:strand:+ start:46072 stop:46464 length:393 start_codon:yes stop_codon:yes gene_type:complete
MKRIKVSGIVVEGAKRGRELGFPTANIELNQDQAKSMPDIGIYAVNTILNNKKYMGAASWGFNPTFGLEKPQLEVHILDFDKMIYGETLSVEFAEFIRGEKKFTSIEKLKETIFDDCIKCRTILEMKEKN